MADGRLLIVTGDVAADPERMAFGVRTLIDAAEEILVVSPVLAGRPDWLASATDRAKEHADERLRAVLGQLEELGAEPEGEVGADDPLLAFEDAIAQFHPDHLLVGLRDDERAGWQEQGLLNDVHERFRLPITFFNPAEI